MGFKFKFFLSYVKEPYFKEKSNLENNYFEDYLKIKKPLIINFQLKSKYKAIIFAFSTGKPLIFIKSSILTKSPFILR